MGVSSRATRRTGARGRSGAPAASSRPDGTQVSDVQRARILHAALEVVGDVGYSGMSVARVTDRAGVSRRTFYDLFEDREDCFLAAFDASVARAAGAAARAADTGDSWRERLRAGLGALLALCDDEPLLGSLLVVEALAAGPRVLAARARVLTQLSAVVDEGRGAAQGKRAVRAGAREARNRARTAGGETPALTAEGVIGAVLAVVHARMLEPDRRPLLALLNPLMGMIVLPYLGPAAAAEERERAVPRAARRPRRAAGDPLDGIDMRLTYRTLRVLAAVAANPAASNRGVAEGAGVQDQGQISKLLARLETLGLIENGGRGHARGEANAWTLTTTGREVQRTISAHGPHGPRGS